MYDFERVQMHALEPVKFVAKQDVGFGNIGKEQSELHSVCQIIEHMVHKLV